MARGFKMVATTGLIGAMAVVAAACGGGSSTSSTHSATAGTSGTTAAPATTAAPTKSKAAGSSSSAGLRVVNSSKYGKYLTTPNGMSLYTYTADKPGGKGCTGKCLKIWPPALLPSGQTTAMAAKGVTGLGTFHRGSRLQVTYRGLPLYTFVKDKAPGQTNGEYYKDSGGEWFLATLSGQPKATGKSSSPTTKAPSGGGAAF